MRVQLDYTSRPVGRYLACVPSPDSHRVEGIVHRSDYLLAFSIVAFQCMDMLQTLRDSANIITLMGAMCQKQSQIPGLRYLRLDTQAGV